MEFLLLMSGENNYIFSSAIFIFLGLAILEGTLLTIGFGITSLLNIDYDIPDAPHLVSEFLGWINKGRVPVIMLLIIFLFVFGVIGLLIQLFTGSIFNQFIVIIPAMLISLPILRVCTIFLAKIMPNDESTAISLVTLVGNIAEITIGTSKIGMKAEAKVKDGYGKIHYVFVEPITDTEYKQGTKVVLVEHISNRDFKCVEEVKSKCDSEIC